jgi:hypothetical protein
MRAKLLFPANKFSQNESRVEPTPDITPRPVTTMVFLGSAAIVMVADREAPLPCIAMICSSEGNHGHL